MNFADAMRTEENIKLTENGALAYKSTGDDLVNLYGLIGSLRNRDESDIESLFKRAFFQDALLATKIAFYGRNIRGGLGEKRVSKVIWRYLAKERPDIMQKNLHLLSAFGRFDDLYSLIGTPVENYVWNLFKTQFFADIKNMEEGKPVSLLAKWLKSVNASSFETKELGRQTARKLGLSEAQYRKKLSKLRTYLKVVENQMSQKLWDDINYSAVPSVAMKNYRKAFWKHNPEEFKEFIDKVKANQNGAGGTEKVNAATLYPYDIIEAYLDTSAYSDYRSVKVDDLLEVQWKAQTNYVEGEHNIVVMADVSESMSGRPMATSIGLAIYFAERNKGIYANQYMTFTNRPHFITMHPADTLLDKYRQVLKTDVGYGTNLEAGFMEILRVAKANKIANEDMPKALVVISDNEIDRYQPSEYNWDFIMTMEDRFNNAGYALPKIILWNVSARQNTFLAKANNPKVQFESGQSPSVFRNVIEGINLNAYDAMIKTLSNPIYDCVQI